jgi:hypothetical protein
MAQNDQPSERLEERDQRQHAEQQHGDTFAVDTDQPTDTSGTPTASDGRSDESGRPEDVAEAGS